MAMTIELQDEKIGLMTEFVEVKSSSSTSTYRDSFHSEEERVYKEVSLDVPCRSTFGRFRSRLGLDRTTYKTESRWRQCCKSAASVILPSFLHNFVLGTDREYELPRPTAYLDGLRGIAALSVVLCHLSLDWFPISAKVAYRPGQGDSILQMPWIRNIYCGRASVCVFFVISGYVLSAKALQQVHTGAEAKVLNTLSSSLFRRAMRLFLPIIFSTLIAFAIVRYDYFVPDPQYPVAANIFPPRFTTFSDQLWHYLNSWSRLTNVYDPPKIDAPYAYPYDGHIWTIPVEYHGSILVFLMVLVTSRVNSTLRPVIISGNAIYNLWQGDWDVFLFLSGVCLADVHVALAAEAPSKLQVITKIMSNTVIQQILIWSAALFGTLVLGCTEDLTELNYPSFFYNSLHAWAPQHYILYHKVVAFWTSIGAVMLITAMSFSPILQRPFTTRFAQYLGFVSYAIYLLHGNVLYTIGTRILRVKVMEVSDTPQWLAVGTSYEGMTDGYHLTFLGTGGICLLIIFWAGDIFTRFVDSPCVRFAAWVERKCLAKIP